MKNYQKIMFIGVIAVLIGTLIYFILNQKEPTFREVDIKYNRNIVFNQTDKSYYDTILYLGLQELGIEGAVVSIRELSEGAKENFREQGGDLTAHLRELNGDYYLFISDIDKSDAIKVISHELIHLKQYHTKELSYQNNVVIWKGKPYNLSEITYDDRPWESDAFTRQTELSNKITNILVTE